MQKTSYAFSKKLLLLFFLSIGYVGLSQDIGGDFYVATWGNDNNPGTYELPWSTWQKAFREAKPGDTVYIRGGVYFSYDVNTINPEAYGGGIGYSGTADAPICYFGYPGEWPILDCIYHCDSIVYPYGDIYNSAIDLSYVEHIHFKDFEIRHVFQCDSVVTGAITAAFSRNLTFEHIIMHSIGQRGYWIMGGAWQSHYDDGGTDVKPYWNTPEDTTLWINCDVYNLFDTLSSSPGNAADAWKTIHYRGNYLLWEGCRAWNYSDDGWDPTPVNGAERVFMNCWAMASNKYNTNSATWTTERNGFKLNSNHPSGGLFRGNSILMTNCLAVYCARGIYEIGGTSSNGVYINNSSVFNGVGYGANSSGYNSIYKNNIVFGSTSLDPGLSRPYEVAMPADYEESHNTWVKADEYPWFKMSNTVPVSYEDFITTDSLQIVALFTAPRKSDGSLPGIKPLMLSPSSHLIDAGIDVGLAFNGTAPDIGAFESDKVTETGNTYPTIEIISPVSENIFTKPCTILFNVLATDPDPDGFISMVELFYNDTIKIKELFAPPWSFIWENPMVGSYSLRAVATDNEGARSISSPEWITVLPGSLIYENSGFLYPNPNNGSFTLLLIEPLQFRSEIAISTIDGKTVYSGVILEEEISKQFDLSGLHPGLYILYLFNNRILFTSRFIKY